MIRTVWLIALVAAIPAAAFAASSERSQIDQVMAKKPSLAHGQEIFPQCARCHGPDGGGQVNGSVPRIAGQHFSVIVRQIIEFRSGKHWDMRMEDIAKDHRLLAGAQDIADVAAYVSSLDGAGRRGIGRGDFTERGETIYRAQCASCHGPAGEGDGRKGIPRIAGQHEGYLLRQMYDAIDGRRPSLSSSHRQRLKSLDFEGIQGLADYIARIGWQEPREPTEDEIKGASP